MKIRWNQSSLRLRITPSELAALESGGSIRESLQFPRAVGNGWDVSISVGDNEAALWQDESGVNLRLSPADLARLSEPEREGVYFTSRDGARPIAYYVEKDFPCAHPRAEEVQALSASGPPTEETFPAPPHFAERL